MPPLQPLTVSGVLADHYRCAEGLGAFRVAALGKQPGFFRFGKDAMCYGNSSSRVASRPDTELNDCLGAVTYDHGSPVLPFDAREVMENLRYERYARRGERWLDASLTSHLYYQIRPLLPVSVRKHLQMIYLRGRERATFPTWPVDRSVDIILERLMAISLKASGLSRIPFIWFWPNGSSACSIMTHDIESRVGRDTVGALLDIDDSFGIRASIQVVPEKRYDVTADFLDMIRSRGFEVNVHGLDHDGNLFEDRQSFLRDARKINEYAAAYGARGFRSPSMYRNVDWIQDLNFSYDMSVPSVARMEPQQGGCCTVMPYFLPGGVTELPLTTVQDYTLFNMLGQYSIDLWKRQIGIVLDGHGLLSFVTHPDYLFPGPSQNVYRQLLEELRNVAANRNVWMALPAEVDQWWRERSRMQLMPSGNGWRIEGPGSDRAIVAYACLDGERLTYEF